MKLACGRGPEASPALQKAVAASRLLESGFYEDKTDPRELLARNPGERQTAAPPGSTRAGGRDGPKLALQLKQKVMMLMLLMMMLLMMMLVLLLVLPPILTPSLHHEQHRASGKSSHSSSEQSPLASALRQAQAQEQAEENDDASPLASLLAASSACTSTTVQCSKCSRTFSGMKQLAGHARHCGAGGGKGGVHAVRTTVVASGR